MFYNQTHNPEQLINCYEQLFHDVKQQYMWWDIKQAVESKKLSDFLKDQGNKRYHTYSEPKLSIAERMIITLQNNVNKSKHNMH